MPIYKRCSRCGKRLPPGTACSCIPPMRDHREYDRSRRDKESAKEYHSKRWEIARAAALDADQHMDVYIYFTAGEIVTADMVHHIVPLRDDRSRAYDIDNLISLSSSTHNFIESRYKTNKAEWIVKLKEIVKLHRQGDSKKFSDNLVTARPSFPDAKF